ncbi:ABC transporter permease [Sphaerisporangium viridialbum]|uniref:ABC transporter permease n=1 Tax=Sphaerisporangium viridialbum TaxID=46189 RepID=UPI003C72DC54
MTTTVDKSPAHGGAAPPEDTFTPGERRRAWMRRKGIRWGLLALLPAVALVGVLFLYPIAYGISLSLTPGEGGTFASYQRFFEDPYLRETVWKTLRIAVVVAVVNTAAAMVFAYPLRGAGRQKKILSTAFLIPMTLGNVLVSSGMIAYLSPKGWLNELLMAIGLIDQPLPLLHNYIAVVIAMVITGLPFAFLLTMSHLAGIDTLYERAAASLGANPWTRFRRILLPLWAPGVIVVFCLTFVLGFSVFASATLVGDPAGSTHVISVEAYFQAYRSLDYSMAMAMVVISALVQILIVGTILLLRSRLYTGPSAGQKG